MPETMFRLERHADIGLDTKYRSLLEARFVGQDDLLDGLVRCSIVRMDKAQDIRKLTTHFP